MAINRTNNVLNSWALIISGAFMLSFSGGAMARSAAHTPQVDTQTCQPSLTSRILNGHQSALDKIRLNQSNQAVPRPMPVATAETCSTQLNPASTFDDTKRLDNFGYLPMKLGRTAFDAQWQRAYSSPPIADLTDPLRSAGIKEGLSYQAILSAINIWVNRSVAYKTDNALYNQRDYWATATETLDKRAGDCEDYAILKLQLLHAAGIDKDMMRLVLSRDLAGNRDHAFLVVATPNGDVVLDNTTDRIYPANQAHSIRPILTFKGDQRWTHAVPHPRGILLAQKDALLRSAN